MDLVIGRGRTRSVFTIPCADTLRRCNPDEVTLLRDNLCSILDINPMETVAGGYLPKVSLAKAA